MSFELHPPEVPFCTVKVKHITPLFQPMALVLHVDVPQMNS
jgi:hypothetical protein